jgi:hypothetical protein
MSEYSLVIVFIDNLQIVTTSDYSAIGNSHTRQFIRARTKISQFAFTSRCLLTAFKGGRSSSCGFQNCPRASATSFTAAVL